MTRALSFLSAGLLTAVHAIAIAGSAVLSGGCNHNHSFAGSCFTVRGRIALYQGTPGMRVWPVGSKRLLGVLPSENEDVPAPLLKLFEQQARDSYIFGTFDVCPLTAAHPGVMQYVCIRSAGSIRVVPLQHQMP